MNFFEVERQKTRLLGKRVEFEYPLSDDVIEAPDGQTTDLTLGIRPEDISLVPAAETQHDFETTVDVVEPRGDENSVYLTFESDSETDDEYSGGETSTFVASVSGLHTVDTGQTVTTRLPEGAIHLFGPDGVALKNRTLDEREAVEPHVSRPPVCCQSVPAFSVSSGV